MAKKPEKRGGARAGAGRPAKQEGDRREQLVSFRVREEVARQLEALAEEGESLNQCARRLLLSRLDEEAK